MSVDDVKKWVETTIANNEELQQLKHQINSGADQALTTVKSGFAVMEAATTEQVKEVKTIVTNLQEVYKAYEDVAFQHMKGGVRYATENPVYTTAIIATAYGLSHRGPWRFLYRNTLGRLRNEEVEVLAAERRVKELQAKLEMYKMDNQKLQERADIARAEYLSGRSKLKGAAGEIQRLFKHSQQMESQATKLKANLRDLPARESIKFRSEVAAAAAEFRQQSRALSKRINDIVRLGV
eukprot:TRINITY_DN7121_c0_g1_i1.p1 TRINITY_DN7121_c0_g1~~TRINITY_DN7121_c0_g1_i1.p1  ORF type:complete len:238 (+),score=54.37 TRINITY_DN7121_c0_g1_i1:166-879(+)